MAYQVPNPKPFLNPAANVQRNNIARTMMNIQNPPPQVRANPVMGLPQMQPAGAPPQGMPTPQMPAPSAMPLQPGVPPQPPGMPPSGMPTGAAPMMPSGAAPGRPLLPQTLPNQNTSY